MNEEVSVEEKENSVINSQDEKQTDDDDDDEEVNGEGDGNSVINTRNQSEEESRDEEQNVDVDWMNEYPPLVSRGIKVSPANSVVEKGKSTTSWLDALKKPRLRFDAREKSDISSDSHEESVASSSGFSSIKIPSDDEVLVELHVAEKDSIRLQLERRVQENGYEHGEVRSARELELKREGMDSHLSMTKIDAIEQQMLGEEHLKTLKKEHIEVKQANDACQASNAKMRSVRAQEQENMKKQFCSYLDEAHSRNQLNKVWNKDKEFRQEYVKSNAKSALGLDEKPVMLPRHVAVVEKKNREESTKAKDIRRHEAGAEAEAEADLKEEVSIPKADLKEDEEMERKEQKVEAEMGEELKAEKREKKRQKRLRLRERKKAVALARDGSSLDPTPLLLSANQNVDKEASTPHDFVSEITSLELKQENEDQESEDQEDEEQEMLKKIETHEASSSLNVQQQTALLELVEVKEAQKREKRRNKKKEKKAKAAAKSGRDKKMKWILIIIFITLILMLCLTNMDLQLLRQILY